jgi:predicted Holliday junction resolvase-like endonuclease
MILEIVVGIIGAAVILSGIVMIKQIQQWKRIEEKIQHPIVQSPPQVNVNLKPVEDKLSDLPNKVLQSITASANTHKGALGELIGYIQLRASYDRIVPLGNIVDFLAIKFPKTSCTGEIIEAGKIVFIDVKTGPRARLSKDQQVFKKLIENKSIEFVKLSISELKVIQDEQEGI